MTELRRTLLEDVSLPTRPANGERALHVHRMRHGLKVVGVDAKRRAAEMVNLKAVRDGAVLALVIGAVRPFSLASANGDATVSVSGRLSDPDPAGRFVASILDGVTVHRLLKSRMVVMDKAKRLSFDVTSIAGRFAGKFRGLATAAFACFHSAYSIRSSVA